MSRRSAHAGGSQPSARSDVADRRRKTTAIPRKQMNGQCSRIAGLTSAWGQKQTSTNLLATRIAAGILFTRIWRATRKAGWHRLQTSDENCVHGCLPRPSESRFDGWPITCEVRKCSVVVASSCWTPTVRVATAGLGMWMRREVLALAMVALCASAERRGFAE